MKHTNFFAFCLVFILCTAAFNHANAQGIAINNDGTSADGSAMLDVKSTDKGILVPRMTATQRDAISSPATGLLVYLTDSAAGFYYYDGGIWQLLANNSSIGWTVNGTNIYVTYDGGGTIADGFFSIATGYNDTASGMYSTAMGYESIASDYFSTAMGQSTHATGDASTAMGSNTIASGQYSTAMGYLTNASGNQSTAIGQQSTASGLSSVAIGIGVTASGEISTAIGGETVASALFSTAIGASTTASGDYSTAMGSYVSTNNQAGSFIIGDSTTAITNCTAANQVMMRFGGGYMLYTNDNLSTGLQFTPAGVAEYFTNEAANYNARSLVDKNYVDSTIGVASGNGWTVNGTNIYAANGSGTTASGGYSTAMGDDDTAGGEYSTAIGIVTNASGQVSTAMGAYTKASGQASTAMGAYTKASGDNTTAMGAYTTASGNNSTAMGYGANATGNISTVMGYNTTASGTASTAMGYSTYAIGNTSTAMGYNTYASGDYSTAMGSYVSTNNRAGSFIIGDSVAVTTNSTAANQMMMRFSGGYILYTNDNLNTGVQFTPAGVAAYLTDVAGSYTARSLVDKNYVDSTLSVTGGGWTVSGTNIYVANGSGATASGGYAIATGYDDTASGSYSTAMGDSATASGYASIAMGDNTHASGVNSIAMGLYSRAYGDHSIVLGGGDDEGGFGVTGQGPAASGVCAIVIGNASWYNVSDATVYGYSTASGNHAIAIGNATLASGNYSTAMGNAVNTNGYTGSFIIGDSTGAYLTNCTSANQMVMRFSGGYKLYTNDDTATGVQFTPAGVAAYLTNVAGSYSARSLVDKNYVDSTLSVTGGGWTVSGSNIYASNGSGTTASGGYSTAMGNNTNASNEFATAIGNSTTASGETGTAMGYLSTASGNTSTAIGYVDTANANYSIAMGNHSFASGASSTAMGNTTIASGGSSTAIGNHSVASGSFASIAMGYYDTASADASTAMGSSTNAKGYGATSMGDSTIASGVASTAMGGNTDASGLYSTAMGSGTIASGNNSTAIGNGAIASGTYSNSMGFYTTASGQASTALGLYVSTNGYDGSFIIGDDYLAETITHCTAGNQMVMRFASGYKLYTKDDTTVGVQIAAGGNSWSTISDRRKKENFAPVNGEDFLKKIDAFKLTSWNYKGQDAKTFRHYGPMAQDFYAAFGKDSYGTIGNDTTINQSDFEGVSFIAIQALEKRTQEQAEKINKLENENAMLKAQAEKYANLSKRLEVVEASISGNDKVSVR